MTTQKATKRKNSKTKNAIGIRAYCSVQRCSSFVYSKGCCEAHYSAPSMKLEHRRPLRRAWRERNLCAVQNYQRAYAQENAQKILADRRLYRHNNRGLYAASRARHRAAKLKATPVWSERELIQAFYDNCPAGYEVDHILPLQGDKICGLHVLSNLQYLTAAENRAKQNFFDFTYDNNTWRSR